MRAEMFGQLTTGLESAWNKLRGVGARLYFFFIPSINASFLLFLCVKDLRGGFHKYGTLEGSRSAALAWPEYKFST